MTEIYQMGVNAYAKEVERMFGSVNAKDIFLGYFPDFGKKNFIAPPGANLGMLFTDTRSEDGKR